MPARSTGCHDCGVDDPVRPEITARRESAEQALRVARDLLRLAVLAVGRNEIDVADFANKAAQQLQQPLCDVRTLARNLRLGVGPATDDSLAFAERIEADAKRMQEQIAELLVKAARTSPRPPK